MSDLKKILSSKFKRDYEPGVLLYSQYPKHNPVFLKRLKQGFGKNNWDLLKRELKVAKKAGWNGSLVRKKTTEKKPLQQIKISPIQEKLKRANVHKKKQTVAFIEKLIKEKAAFYKEFLDLHVKLSYLGEGEKLAAVHNRIVDIFRLEINPRHKIIDDYNNKGIMPDELHSLTIDKLFRELKNIPTKISRLNRLLKTEKKDDKIENFRLQKKAHEKQLSELEKVLKSFYHLTIDEIKCLL